jgi:enoyl-CoA hydratase/carnithine racemase
MWADIDLALDVLTADEEVKVLVIEGAGGSFSSGIDLAELGPGGFLRALADIAPQQPDPALEAIARAQRPFRRLRATPFIVVAAVRGVALGAGLELALACDFTIVSTTARLAVSEVGRGVVPDLGATWALPRLVGPQRALDLILTSREFTGLEAAEYGVALAAVPDGEVEAAADAYAARLATVPGRVLAHAKAATLASDEGASMRAAAVGMAESIRSLLGPA